MAVWKKKWASQKGKFPGAQGSLEDKLEWLHWVKQGEIDADTELLWDSTRPYDTDAVTNEILYENWTPKVHTERF